MGKGLIKILLLNVWWTVVILPALFTFCQKHEITFPDDIEFNIEPENPLTTQTVLFKILSVAGIQENQKLYFRWNWDGDSVWDSQYSSAIAYYRRFYIPGDYTVSLQYTDGKGNRKVLSKTISIKQGYSAPKPSFSISPSSGNFTKEFLFDASLTSDDEDSTDQLQFRWDFQGDGNWDTPYETKKLVYKKFDRPGLYNPVLQVLDPSKLTATTTQELEVHSRDTLILVSITWTPDQIKVGDTVVFDASGTYYTTHPDWDFQTSWILPNSFSWSSPSYDKQIQFIFSQEGNKEIQCKIIIDHSHLENQMAVELYVAKENFPPEPYYKISTQYGNISTLFYFDCWESKDDNLPPSQILLRWDWENDGIWDTPFSEDKEYFHQFTEPGIYTVALQAMDNYLVKATVHGKVRVSPYDNPTSFIRDGRDNKMYGTVKIGSKWWMTENLDYRDEEKMNIPMFQKCYNEDERMCDLYGSLYQAGRCLSYVEEGNQICPKGWRIPDREDVEELASLIPANDPRNSLMVDGSMGFNARYTGFGSYVFKINSLGMIEDTTYTYERFSEEVRYLTLTKRNSFTLRSQWLYGIQRDYDDFNQFWGNIDGYFPIRCIKDE